MYFSREITLEDKYALVVQELISYKSKLIMEKEKSFCLREELIALQLSQTQEVCDWDISSPTE